MTEIAIRVDPEFKSLIPPLRPEEREQLEANLVAEGCRDALVVWAEKDILLDGHNRFSICKKLGIPYKTKAVKIADRLDAKIWILQNQAGRRNLTEGQKAMSAAALVDLLSKAAMRDRGQAGRAAGGKATADQKADRLEENVASGRSRAPKKDRSRRTAAERTKVSEWKVRQAQEIRKADPELAAKVVAGEIDLYAAAREVKKNARLAKRAALHEEIKRGNAQLPIGQRKYAVIYADPPWMYECNLENDRAVDNHYPTMPTGDICALPVSSLALDAAILFLWTTAPKVLEAGSIIQAWGFTYKTCAIWDKTMIGIGNYFRTQHEILMVATRGEMPAPDQHSRPPWSIYAEKRGKHSVKPVKFYEVIEAMYPDAPRIELFARGGRKGWDSWGFEADNG